MEPTAVPTPEVIIIGPTDDYPEGCQPNEVVELLLSFLDAYNTGNTVAIDQTFAEHIEWYSDTKGENEQNHFVTYTRDGILPYVAIRQEQQDQLALLWLNVLPKTWHGGVDINYMLQREANDLESGPDGRPRLVSGKGAIHCPDRKIFVWSMGTLAAWEVLTTHVLSCNGTSETFSAEKIVVCAYGTE
ncbi:MAG: hypothetical protein H6656_12445 [Ardenticatenaceae bacterium]|nr:hypothetical protein [Anaerolineales bacterium]MCB9008156.1 hypothetical protein [Ardenticatenaceae bacterium]